mgnify:CR=1 FL=1
MDSKVHRYISLFVNGKTNKLRKVDCVGMEIAARIFCLVLGYCLGLIQTSYIYGKLHGIDIREYGSGNAGTTNALRVLGKKAGLVVFLGDFFKAAIACILARYIGVHFFHDIMYPMILWAGFGVVIGHNYPFYMGFKGGKGIAATAGVIFGTLDWRIMAVCLVSFIVVVAATRYVSLGSLVVVTLFFLTFLCLGMCGKMINPVTRTPYNGKDLIESYIIIFLFGGLAFYRHKANIVRLMNGEENKISFKKNAD